MPSAASAAPRWQRRLNEVSGRRWTSGPMSGGVRMRIIHPMDTGLVAGSSRPSIWRTSGSSIPKTTS